MRSRTKSPVKQKVKQKKRSVAAKRRKPKGPARPPADDIAAIRERLKAAILELDRKAPQKPGT